MENLMCDKKELGLLDKIHIILTCFIISWFNNGIVIQVLGARAVVLFGAFGIWTVLSCYFDKYFLWTFIKKAKWLLIWSAIVCIYSINLYVFWNKQSYGALYIPIIYSIGVFFRREGYDKHKKIILTYFFAECIIICIKSIYILKTNPMYSRSVAGGGEAIYSMVVGYAAVYGFVALIIFLLNMRGCYEKKYKFLVYLFVIAAIFTTYMANYATAIFLGAVFIIFAMISKKKWSMALFISACILGVILLKPYISELFLWISEWDISDHLQSKAYQLAMSLQGKKVAINTFDSRMEYMRQAFEVFKKAPMLGIYGRQELTAQYNYMLRDHNVWIDMLGHYGILRSIPLVLFYFSWYKDTVNDKSEIYSYAVFCAAMFCVVCGFFNPINKNVVQLVMFIIIPMSDALFKDKVKTYKPRFKNCGIRILE